MKPFAPQFFREETSRRLRVGMAALALGAASLTGVAWAQQGGGGEVPTPHQSGMMHHGPQMDPEHMIEHLVPDATPEQKSKLAAIRKAAFADLKPLHEKRRATHEQMIKILAQPTIDRSALEKARQEGMQAAEQISKRMTQEMADAAEVLTPAQRAKVAEELQKHHDHMGHGRRHAGEDK